MNDLRYALRQLRKSPGFTFVAVLTLALGIGANTTIFSVVDSVLLHPLGFKEPERLVAVWETNEQPGAVANRRNEVARGNFYDWRAQNEVFESIAALTYGNFNLSGVAEPERIQGAFVSYDFFGILGVQPAAGRAFVADEGKAGTPRVAVISHALWQRRFGADPALVGRTVTFNGEPFTILGIMPADFDLRFPAPFAVELWTVLRGGTSDTDRVAHFLYTIARLKPDVSLEQAQAAMNVIARRLQEQYPDTNSGAGVNIVPLQTQLVGNIQPYLYVLFAAVGFVLLIACANVANLVLARLTGRQKEIAVRLALGASRGRLIRQFLSESLLLSTFGALLGLLLAAYAIGALPSIAPADLPRLDEIGLNRPAFFWSAGLLVFTTFLFGLLPALQASKPDLNNALQQSGRASGGPQRSRLSRVLVVSEIALALLLLVGAGLMIRSSLRLQRVDPGFDQKNLLTLNLALPRQKYPQNPQALAFFDQLLARIAQVPGVDAVGGVDPLPMSGNDSNTGVLFEGQPIVPMSDRPGAGERVVTPGYFRALRIPLLEGRDFNDRDRADTPRVLIVNEALARRFFPGQSAIGKRLGVEDENRLDWAEIVGVVGNVKHQRLDAETKPELYQPYSQNPRNFISIAVRSTGEPGSLLAPIRAEVAALDPDQPIYQISTMESLLARTLAQSRFVMLLLGIFSALAMALAAVGIYGVMSWFVTQRSKEIGIRMALGAQQRDVLSMVVREGMLLAVLGVALGLAGSFALTRIIANLLYSVGPTDPATLAGVSVLLSAVAFLACWFPARRAARVDPMITLRAE